MIVGGLTVGTKVDWTVGLAVEEIDGFRDGAVVDDAEDRKDGCLEVTTVGISVGGVLGN